MPHRTTDIRILDVRISHELVEFRVPLKFGGRVADHMRLISAAVDVELSSGRSATGHGSMPIGNIWAWPSAVVGPNDTERAMLVYADKAAELFGSYPEFGHPMDIQFTVGAEFGHQAERVATTLELPESLPPLAQLVAVSPIDAALHDAYGRVHSSSSFNVLSSKYCSRDLSEFLDDQFVGEFLDQYTLREPKASLPLYHLVGALDPLTPAEAKDLNDDGLPHILGDWIAADGLTYLKIKLAGNDLDWDIDRMLGVDRVSHEAQSQRGCSQWQYSCDFNESCENAEYVLEFLNRVRDREPEAFNRIQYIEQPTNRDLKSASAAKMHDVAAIKPVVIDEALVDYESLLASRDLGYSGVALKACKGQSESLLAAAAAQKFDMFLCVQDLTCPGASWLHSCSLAARIPGISAIEGNARQYCPAANTRWAKLYPGLFSITDGTVATGRLSEAGLGFSLKSQAVYDHSDE